MLHSITHCGFNVDSITLIDLPNNGDLESYSYFPEPVVVRTKLHFTAWVQNPHQTRNANVRDLKAERRAKCFPSFLTGLTVKQNNVTMAKPDNTEHRLNSLNPSSDEFCSYDK